MRARERSRPRISRISNMPKPTDLPVTATRKRVDHLTDLDALRLDEISQQLLQGVGLEALRCWPIAAESW